MSVRLLETSLLVFFKKRTTKATIATAVAVSSLTIAQKYKPWLRDSDDKVRSSAATQNNTRRSLTRAPRRSRRSRRGFCSYGSSR